MTLTYWKVISKWNQTIIYNYFKASAQDLLLYLKLISFLVTVVGSRGMNSGVNMKRRLMPLMLEDTPTGQGPSRSAKAPRKYSSTYNVELVRTHFDCYFYSKKKKCMWYKISRKNVSWKIIIVRIYFFRTVLFSSCNIINSLTWAEYSLEVQIFRELLNQTILLDFYGKNYISRHLMSCNLPGGQLPNQNKSSLGFKTRWDAKFPIYLIYYNIYIWKGSNEEVIINFDN